MMRYVKNFGKSVTTHTKIISLSNTSYLQFNEWRMWMIFTTHHRAITNSILKIILLWRSPINIVQRIIRTTIYSMTRKHSFWSWRNKRLENKWCAPRIVLLRISVKAICVMTIFINSRFHSLRCINKSTFTVWRTTRPDRAIFGSVVSGEAMYRFEHIGKIKMLRSSLVCSNTQVYLTANPEAF